MTTSFSSRFHIFRVLAHHRHLADRRMIPHKGSVLAQLGLWFLCAFTLLYFAYLGVMFAFLAIMQHSFAGWQIMYMIVPVVLIIDFFFRFIAQQTPSQLVIPYLLLPIPKYTCVEAFLVRNLFDSYNIFWFALFLPYAFPTILISQSFGAFVGALFGFYLLVLVNAEWYLICRTLINRSFIYWLLPIAVYGLFALPICIDPTSSLNTYAHWMSSLAKGLTFGNPLYYLAVLLAIALLFVVNRRLQFDSIRKELRKNGRTHKASTVSFHLFDRWGTLGSYIKLEFLCLLRNRNPRKALISYLLVVVTVSLLLCFLGDSFDVLGGFWMVYMFFIYGAFHLVGVMTYEGNYIDILMMHSRSVYNMLLAKYLVALLMMLVPVICLIHTIFTNGVSLIRILAVYAFMAGFVHFMIFQLAVYNNQTRSLNEKVTGKTMQLNNALQMIVCFMGFLVPLFFLRISDSIIGTTATDWLVLSIGLVFILTSRLWIGNIYKRMMSRKYKNLDNFKATRS